MVNCKDQSQSQRDQTQTETTTARKYQSQSQRDQTQIETTIACKNNLSQSQRDLLLWHQCLGHTDFAAVQDRSRHDPLMPKHIANCKHPVCPACQYGKAKQRSKGKQRSIIHGCPEIGRECWSNQQISDCATQPKDANQHHFTNVVLSFVTMDPN